MNHNKFNPYVRFCKRRRLSSSYPYRVYAYDFRLLYVVRGSFEVELDNQVIRLEEFSMLTIPPGIGYRLIIQEAPVEFFIINFDFDSDHAHLPARAPVQQEEFSKEEIFSRNCIAPFETVFHLRHARELESAFRELDTTEDTPSSSIIHIQSALMKYILSKAAHLHIAKREKGESPHISAIKEYVDRNFAQRINNKIIATEMGYHPHYLNTCFLQSEGITLHTYIELTRLKHAQKQLTTTQDPIFSIARACGFQESSYFTKFFFRHTGMTPKQYRELFI